MVVVKEGITTEPFCASEPVGRGGREGITTEPLCASEPVGSGGHQSLLAVVVRNTITRKLFYTKKILSMVELDTASARVPAHAGACLLPVTVGGSTSALYMITNTRQ